MQIEHVTVYSERLTHPVRALVLADLHEQCHPLYLSAWTSLHPELILIPGDWLEAHSVQKSLRRRKTLALLRALAERFPTFYSLGNHEIGVSGCRRPRGAAGESVRATAGPQVAELIREIEATGACLLDDRWVRWGEFAIGGVSSAAGGMIRTGFLERYAGEAGFRLLLCHHPEYYPRYLRRYETDLVVSGHAHGGQWRIAGRGVFAPGQGIFPRYTDGLYENNHLLVSRGLADRTPVPRILNPKQTLLLHLLPQEMRMLQKQAGK